MSVAHIVSLLTFYQMRKLLTLFKLNTFAADNFSVAQMAEFCFDRVENIVGKGKKCWKPAFSPFPNMFFEGFLSVSLNVLIVW